MRITALELKEQIAGIDRMISAERVALEEQRAKMRDLRQAREIKVRLLGRLEEQGLDSIELPC
ncbi:MAG TPA: hypothetical protein VJZ26_08685 [Blastocatellia bacterium]|nr:hypothetical protein [Blastocatellia bacterium]